MGEKNWTCTNSWLHRWKGRHGLVFKKMHGERSSVDEKSTDAWVKDILRPTLDRYKDDDVYNVDETGLFWKLLPDSTFALKGETCTGGKKSRERVTVMLCCNMTGTDKRQPILIGKYAKPRCFKQTKKDLPVQYDSNASAWMTKKNLQTWLHQFNGHMGRQKKGRFFSSWTTVSVTNCLIFIQSRYYSFRQMQRLNSSPLMRVSFRISK